ncbi:hypothetical protein M501DRAFT_605446 [Patellaria atrata CBS 101060]|uniref:Uncharacterized protein n=1 Tax=Patellaria atrata CBS 101060 TaxID=1346257 RepID=A0A9P4VM13_9PEZI|nr:hypothetical protein M501DRAFT_605446 [Patellaria atrata CBS 101060]
MEPSPWVEVSHTGNSTVLREYKVGFGGIVESSQTTPCIVTLIGGRAKSALLRQLLGKPNLPTLVARHNRVFLWSDPKTLRNHSPTVFIDSELHTHKVEDVPEVGACTKRAITWFTDRSQPMGNRFHIEVLSPVSDVVCYFSSDLRGFEGIAQLLAEQALHVPTHGLPRYALPRVVVVLDTSSETFDPSAAESRLVQKITSFMRSARGESSEEQLLEYLYSNFFSIGILGLRTGWNNASRAKVFRKRIRAVVLGEHQSSVRHRHGFAFNCGHLKAMCSLAIQSFCDSSPFNFIDASRPLGYDSQFFTFHLQNVLQCMPSCQTEEVSSNG